MTYYRIYSMKDKHIVDFRDFDADGDAAAILNMQGGTATLAQELWTHGRKVLDFAASSPLLAA